MRVIRWLGAFRKGGDLVRALQWEAEASREVAAQVCTRFTDRPAGGAVIGLLVRSDAVRQSYRRDAWTEVSVNNSSRLVATRRAFNRFRSGRVPRRSLDTQRRHRHTEAICRPEYCAVVTHKRATPAQRRLAHEVAERLGLPYLSWYDLWKGGD